MKILISFPQKSNFILKNLSYVVFLSSISFILCYSLGKCSLGIYEGIYGIGLCQVSPSLLPAAASSPPYVVAIDPGHGGTDTGALAIVKEFEVIDKTAARLYELLEDDPDFIPVMTRTDSDPESAQRATVANNAGASLLISIHANSDSHKSSKGFECFAQPPGRTYHQDSYRFAQLIVAQMSAAGHHIRGDEQKTGIKYAYYYGNDKKIVDSSDSQVRSRKSFGILEKTNCPRVLVEQCFITNYSDVENWATDDGCNRAAQLYYAAIKEYFKEF